MDYLYPVTLEPDPDGGFVVTCPDLPEVVTQADDEAGALAGAEDAVAEALASRLAHGESVPAPSTAGGGPVAGPGPVMAAKAALADAMAGDGVTRADLAERLGVAADDVERLLNPRHNTPIERLAAALRCLGRRLTVGVDAA